MTPLRLNALTTLAMMAFAGNSLLARAGLDTTTMDPATFTSLRLASGAAMLWLLVTWRSLRAPGSPVRAGAGNWPSALALWVYAAGFSFAYVSLPAGTGALLLFGSVQATMIGFGLFRGDRLRGLQWVGLALAGLGLVVLLSPGLAAPPVLGSLLMVTAGVAWGVYSLRGQGAGDPLQVTAGNFLRAVPVALVLSAVLWRQAAFDVPGVAYAVASGTLASGIGYAVWYTALPALKSIQAATVQLSVPVITALGGLLFLGEVLSLRFVVASVAVLGGIALVIVQKRTPAPNRQDVP